MELELIPAKTGIGTMKILMLITPFPVWAGIEINSSPNRKWKDMQLLIKYCIRSCMSFLFGGQLSTDKIQFSVHFKLL